MNTEERLCKIGYIEQLKMVTLKFEVFISSFFFLIPIYPTLALLVMVCPFVPSAAFVRVCVAETDCQ